MSEPRLYAAATLLGRETFLRRRRVDIVQPVPMLARPRTGRDMVRIALGIAALSASLAVLQPAVANGQTYPDRSVRMVVAFSAGGTLDTLARIMSQKLSEAWGQSVVVENRAGAGGNIGAAAAAQSAPDGYTLHFGAQSLAVNVTIAPQRGFDPVKDFDPVVLVATAQDVLMVPADSPIKSVK